MLNQIMTFPELVFATSLTRTKEMLKSTLNRLLGASTMTNPLYRVLATLVSFFRSFWTTKLLLKLS